MGKGWQDGSKDTKMKGERYWRAQGGGDKYPMSDNENKKIHESYFLQLAEDNADGGKRISKKYAGFQIGKVL